jgi:hypothetical protein
MGIRYRSLLPEDVPNLVSQVAVHPVLGSRYGPLIDDFGAALLRSLGRNYEIACAFEEVDGSRARLLGAGLAGFVTAEFLREVKTRPGFWVGPELVKRILSDANPLLSDNEVRDANSRRELNLLVWHTAIHPNDLNRPEVGVTAADAFFSNFLGFQVTEMLTQADSFEHLQGSRNLGCCYFDRRSGCYGDFPDVNRGNFEREPHNIGLDRQSTYTLGHLWSLFCCPPAQIGLSSSEQRMLRLAFDGGTDEELCTRLHISLTAVKKYWRSIYDRTAEALPHLFADRPRQCISIRERGKERRRRILAYLRGHPEELRPVSRNLLRQSAKLRQ